MFNRMPARALIAAIAFGTVLLPGRGGQPRVLSAASYTPELVPSHAQGSSASAGVTQAVSSPAEGAARTQLLKTYCLDCHNAKLKTAGLGLGSVDGTDVGPNAALWEKVLRKVRTGQMPPVGRARPDKDTALRFTGGLSAALDRAATADPDPGRPAVHRLNRTEYVGAIRALLELEIDGRSLLPPDDS